MNNQTPKIDTNQLYESDIITKDEIPLLIGWLPKYPTKIIKLFDTKIDTHNAGAFHSKCDDKGPTIVLIKSDSNYRFGGYTSISWGTSIQEMILHFYFLLITKKNIMLIHQTMLFIPIINMGQLLVMVMIFIYLIMLHKIILVILKDVLIL